jgi:PTS system ascorbate-specific IIA component
MSVGLLIISHNDVGRVMLRATVSMLGINPLRVALLSVSMEDEPEELRRQARELVQEVDRGDGVLLLTDLYGSTPSNVANCDYGDHRVNVVAGLNMPMLLRVLNYPKLGLDELTDKAVSGGIDGVMRCPGRNRDRTP